jgi:hypothetical protein
MSLLIVLFALAACSFAESKQVNYAFAFYLCSLHAKTHKAGF